MIEPKPPFASCRKSMISDRELWACANEVIRQHGEGAGMFVAERIAALAQAGDLEGIATWQSIGLKVLALESRGEALQ